ncbi:MAG: ABC transporter permease [Bacillota bacterium]
MKQSRLLAQALAVGTLLLVWQTGAWLLPDFLLPDVPGVAARILQEMTGGPYLRGVATSLVRLAAGYLSAVLLGTVLGLAGGLSQRLALYLKSLIAILQAVPPITWLPFLIIILGFGSRPVIMVVAVASFFPMALSVLGGIESVERIHVDQARVLGASRWQLLSRVYLPETLPAVVTGAQVAFGNAWRSLIASEMVGGFSQGLGWSMSYSGEVADMKGVLAGIVIIGALALLMDRLVLERLKRKLLPWRYTEEGHAA